MDGVQIQGAKGRISDPARAVAALQSLPDELVLAMDADMVCGRAHLESAVSHAIRAFKQGGNACNNIAMETLLFASGERQISKAQQKMGLKEGTSNIALISFRGGVDDAMRALHLEPDDSALDCSKEKAIRFGIEAREIGTAGPERAQDLVLERVAFVEIIKR